MFYLFFGEDTFQSRRRLHEFLEEISKKSRHSSVWLAPHDFTKPYFNELLRTSSLFGEKQIFVCENLLKEGETADFIVKNTKLCAKSENIFIFWEEQLETPLVNAFKKHAEKNEEFKFLSPREIRAWLENEAAGRKISLPSNLKEELAKQCGADLWSLSQELEKYCLTLKTDSFSENKKEETNIFHITDAIASRDKSRAWFLFRQAMMNGMDAEEIFWKIVWQIKNLLLIKKLMPASEKKITETTRLHPYVVKKTASASRLFTEEELSKYSSELIELYHNSRRGLADFDTGVEKILIKL